MSSRVIHAPRGAKLNCKSWHQEAALCCLMNNLDPEVAERPDELILVAVFRDRESYRANADDPEQDKWYRQLREHLQADPEWTDGEVVFAGPGATA